jgi:cytochrome c553
MDTRMRFAGFLLALGLACTAVPAIAQNVANGNALFHADCVPCHGFPPLGGPELAPNNPALITQAINGQVPGVNTQAMLFLRPVLSAGDIADIAAYIGSLSAPAPPPPVIVPAFDFTDLWWNANESGWGLNLIQHPSHNIFGVMYTYDLDHRPMWLVLPGGVWGSPLLFSGKFYRVTGPPPTGPFDPNKVGVVEIGTATLTFTDRDNGTFIFSVNGVQVSKAITRTPY